jgi:hypothetical protein
MNMDANHPAASLTEHRQIASGLGGLHDTKGVLLTRHVKVF